MEEPFAKGGLVKVADLGLQSAKCGYCLKRIGEGPTCFAVYKRTHFPDGTKSDYSFAHYAHEQCFRQVYPDGSNIL